MGYTELIFNFGSTIGAGFLVLFGFAFALSTTTSFYSLVFCALLFLAVSYLFLNTNLLKEKKILKFVSPNWLIFFGEVCWISLCALVIEAFLIYFFNISFIPIATLLILLPIIIFNFGKSKSLLVERIIFSFAILLFAIIIPYSSPVYSFEFSKLSPDFLSSIPIIFIFFLGFEKTLDVFPELNKSAAKKIAGISILAAFLFYVFLMAQFTNPLPSSTYLLSYFSPPIQYFLAAIVIAITFGSMNSSFLGAISSLSKIDYRLYSETTKKKIFRIFFIFVLAAVLVSIKNILLLAYLVSASYIAMFLIMFLETFLVTYNREVRWLSFFIIPVLVFIFLQIPLNVLILFALVFAIGFFFREK